MVVCGGAIETPALLRSGLRGQVGHDLHLHPGTAAWGIFENEVHLWEGTLQARLAQAARVMEVAGGRKVYSLHKSTPSYVPGLNGAYESWVETTTRLGYRGGAATLASYHQMGSCRMGIDPSASAVDQDNRVPRSKRTVCSGCFCLSDRRGSTRC